MGVLKATYDYLWRRLFDAEASIAAASRVREDLRGGRWLNVSSTLQSTSLSLAIGRSRGKGRWPFGEFRDDAVSSSSAPELWLTS